MPTIYCRPVLLESFLPGRGRREFLWFILGKVEGSGLKGAGGCLRLGSAGAGGGRGRQGQREVPVHRTVPQNA